MEMESSMMYRFCASKGFEVRAATILTSDGNLNDKETIYAGNLEENTRLFAQGVDNTIKITISAIESMNSNN